MEPTPDLMPLVSVALGIGLAAACGLRVFLPLLVVGVAARHGYLTLGEGFGWLASDAALVALGTATVIEVVAYHVPFLDHLLDVLATPSAVVAGTVATASVLTDVPPVVASLELFGALGTVVLVIALPFVGIALVAVLLAGAFAVVARSWRRRALRATEADGR
ncbi:MAG: DUF4126 domain-containing protein [Thermodesulfobacteriota bacterium]